MIPGTTALKARAYLMFSSHQDSKSISAWDMAFSIARPETPTMLLVTLLSFTFAPQGFSVSL